MRTIAIANASGSAGKTTTAVSIAALLGEQGRRVLVIDLDAQANAGTALGIVGPPTITAVLDQVARLGDVIQTAATAGVQVAPSDRALDATAARLQSTVGGEQRLRLALRDVHDVDVVLIDCPGALGILTAAAVIASDSCITVTQPSAKELEGIPELLGFVDQIADAYGRDVRVDAIVPCQVPRGRVGYAQEGTAALEEYWPSLITPPVRTAAVVRDAYSRGVPLPVYAPSHGVTDDYRAVVAHLIERGVL